MEKHRSGQIGHDEGMELNPGHLKLLHAWHLEQQRDSMCICMLHSLHVACRFSTDVVHTCAAGVFVYWVELPVALQQAVGAAALSCRDAEGEPCHHAQTIRLSCHALRDGIDAARTRLSVRMHTKRGWHMLNMLPIGMAVDTSRFCSLKRLNVELDPDPDEANIYGHVVQFQAPPAWLQELHITRPSEADGGVQLYALPPHATAPHLHTLVLHRLGLPPVFDCALLRGLQRLKLKHCSGLNLANLPSCSSLRALDISKCQLPDGGLDPATLSQLPQLERLVLVNTGIKELDVRSLPPSLTHLDVGTTGTLLRHPLDISTSALALPGGAPRSALRHLGLHNVRHVCSYDLAAAPNLESLDISHLRKLAPLLDLNMIPSLKHLNIQFTTTLHALHLTSSIQSLDVSRAPLQALDLSGCSCLTRLSCCSVNSLTSLDLTPVSTTLTHLDAVSCRQLQSLNLAACTKLAWLNLSCNTALEQLNLSDCVSIKDLLLEGSDALGEVDVGACSKLHFVQVRKGHARRVVGAGKGVSVSELSAVHMHMLHSAGGGDSGTESDSDA